MILLSAKQPRPFSVSPSLHETEYHRVPIIIRGAHQILKIQSLLADLCMRCGQHGGWEDLHYFFSLPFARNKTPYLLLFVSRPGLTPETLFASDIVAAVLTHEYHLWHVPTRIFATDDSIGRRTVVAPPALRSKVALFATHVLMDRGAEISLITYQDDPASSRSQYAPHLRSTEQACLWATQQREFFAYLPLESDFEATMAKLGKRTRSNMRYYRRRAERDLGCTFVPNVQISETDFHKFNRLCSFAVSDEVSAIRYKALANSPHSFLAGICNRQGQWLSIVSGQKNHDFVEIYWQMNLAALPAYSISTVMRSFLIEHAISCGTRKLLIEGGTPHSMRFSFVREIASDVIARRKSLYGMLITRFAKLLMLKKNFLSHLLISEKLHWQSWSATPPSNLGNHFTTKSSKIA